MSAQHRYTEQTIKVYLKNATPSLFDLSLLATSTRYFRSDGAKKPWRSKFSLRTDQSNIDFSIDIFPFLCVAKS